MTDNLELWKLVGKTDPRFVKSGTGKGYSYSAIAPYYQMMLATEQFGPYGKAWGLFNTRFTFIPDTDMVLFECVFKFPEGEFPISNVIKYKGIGQNNKEDDDFAKKVETDTITKSLSRLGFNNDVFLGKFDDSRYVDDLNREINQSEFFNQHQELIELVKNGVNAGPTDPLWIESSLKWYLAGEEVQKGLWVAPTKGGPFSTEERKIIKSVEWYNAMYDSLDEQLINEVITQSEKYIENQDYSELYTIWSELSALEKQIIKYHMPETLKQLVHNALTEQARLMIQHKKGKS